MIDPRLTGISKVTITLDLVASGAYGSDWNVKDAVAQIQREAEQSIRLIAHTLGKHSVRNIQGRVDKVVLETE